MTKDKALTEKLYENLRRHRGSLKKVADRVGCHRNWVRMVLKGTWEDHKLIEIAANVLAELEEDKSNSVLNANKKLNEALTTAKNIDSPSFFQQ